MPQFRLTLAALIILLIFYACKKQDAASANGARLKGIIHKQGDSIAYSFFSYDAQGRLTTIIDSNNNGHRWKTRISYNEQGKLTKDTIQYYACASCSPMQIIDSFLYDNNGHIIKKFVRSGSGPSFTTIRNYSYDAQGRLSADSMYDMRTNEVYFYSQFSYDGNDNVVQWESFDKSSGIMSSSWRVTAKYNNIKNPYNTFGLVNYIILREWDILLLSKHNPTQLYYLDGTTTDYTYEYYYNGLLKKAVEKDSRGGQFSVTTREFFY